MGLSCIGADRQRSMEKKERMCMEKLWLQPSIYESKPKDA